MKNFDLTATGRELSTYSWGKEIAGAIRRIGDRRSAQVDFDYIEAALKHLKDYQASVALLAVPEREDDQAALITQAFFVYAVVVYARVTTKAVNRSNGKSKNKKSTARFTLEVDSWLTDSEKIDHDRIVKLRNTLFAHFDPGQDDEGSPWVREFLSIEVSKSGSQLTYPYSRANLFWPDIERLDNLMKRIVPRLADEIDKREGDLIEKLERLENRECFENILKSYPVDLSSWYGVPDIHEGAEAWRLIHTSATPSK